MKITNKTLALVAMMLFSVTTLTACDGTGNALGGIAQSAQNFQQPTINIKSFNVEGASLQEIVFKVTLTIENKNNFSIKTSNIDYNLDIAGAKIVNGSLVNGIDLPAQKSIDIDLPIKVDTQKLLTAVPNIITKLSELDYAVYGTVNFDTPVGKVPLNWKKEDKINLFSLASLILSALAGGGK